MKHAQPCNKINPTTIIITPDSRDELVTRATRVSYEETCINISARVTLRRYVRAQRKKNRTSSLTIRLGSIVSFSYYHSDGRERESVDLARSILTKRSVLINRKRTWQIFTLNYLQILERGCQWSILGALLYFVQFFWWYSISMYRKILETFGPSYKFPYRDRDRRSPSRLILLQITLISDKYRRTYIKRCPL